MAEERWDWTSGDVGRVSISTLGYDRDTVDGGWSEDELETADEGRREASGLGLMVELNEVSDGPSGWKFLLGISGG